MKKGLLGFLIFMGFLCAALHWHVDMQIRHLLVRDGFTPFPGPLDGDMPLYWINRPGHLLRIVGVTDSDLGDTILLVGPALFFAMLGWCRREGIMPYLIVPLGVGICILISGAFFAPIQFPLDFSIDQDRGVAISGSRLAELSDIASITIAERTGARSGPGYWLVAHLKTGGAIDLTVFETRAAAAAVLERVSTAMPRSHPE
ncbi:MAG: hypothetical protein ACYCZB_00550 [Acidiphilium sp.]